MTSADRYRRAQQAHESRKEIHRLHLAGDGKRAHFVISCSEVEGGCVRVYFRDLGRVKITEIIHKLMVWLFD